MKANLRMDGRAVWAGMIGSESGSIVHTERGLDEASTLTYDD